MGHQSPEDCPQPWQVLTVWPQRERNAARVLELLGVEHYLPTCTTRTRWSDRVHTTVSPLFAGYVFARYRDPSLLAATLRTGAVRGVLKYGGDPAVLSDAEIGRIRAIAQTGTAEPCEAPPLTKGSTVRVIIGGAEVTGTLDSDTTERRIYVTIASLGRTVSVRVDRCALMPVAA